MQQYWYKNILLTWEPGCGKTTLMKDLISTVDKKSWILTEQVLDDWWERVWFELVDTIWHRYLLSSTNTKSDIIFADKYFIQTQWLKDLINNFTYQVGDLLYLDEIAPMQLYTPWFTDFIESLLDAKNPLLWVIKLDDTEYEFIQKVKKRKDVLIVNISDDNYDKAFLVKLLWKIKKSQWYVLESDRFHQTADITWSMRSASATRNLVNTDWVLMCDCQFYNQYGICSHSIALRQII